ncbi:hypothetical protein [Methanosphaerula palustris]|uniref:Uncharacterized protein n=1 Tax=Methanosphaerula palustris (strain ATCC BAA-1556 / DSM 19958 / E1-9c) TaxID=521011 RepID=B8GHV6_METPE|nr:hypothetical protein [Methanosphaerula palustris]ACL16696.1 hypothetical protein Mpal_1365 [Methanosphaerula palustris E1-9c]
MTPVERAAFKEIRGRPLITDVTSSRPQAEGSIAGDVIPEFCRTIWSFR